MTNSDRAALNNALDCLIHLEFGLPFVCSPIADADQRRVLLRAKEYVKEVLFPNPEPREEAGIITPRQVTTPVRKLDPEAWK